MTDKTIQLDKTKGRPMLHWVGKKPLAAVKPYPAQLTHQYGFAAEESSEHTLNFNNLTQDWHHLLLHGENKEILSTLIAKGFRGKIDLIYIDPPFDSAADYVRRVELRGIKSKVQGEEQNVIEQTQYTDIWQNDTYLQFMYERLILMRELLSDKGSIYLHCDWHKSHHLRFLMDEIFGEENFVNEIIWHYQSGGRKESSYSNKHDTIFWYSKSSSYYFNSDIVSEIRGEKKRNNMKRGVDDNGEKYWSIKSNGKIYKYYDDDKVTPADVWLEISHIQQQDPQRVAYPTQKPEALLERIVKASSNEDSIVLDCFAGSGTLAAVAQKLGRKWIISDINKGAIQTTTKRLQKIITEQNGDLVTQSSIKKFCHYHINNYDFQQRDEAVQIVIEKYGIERIKTDSFFNGMVKGELVKILDFNRPCNMLDVQAVKDELKDRPQEERNIRLIASGVEFTVENELLKHNKTHPINKITVNNIQTDGVILFEKSEAEIQITKKKGIANICINNYFSPTIMKRLDMDKTLFSEHITDFRSQIDTVLIDNAYNGKVFNICLSDIPEKKQDFIKAEYQLKAPSNAKIAVKIIDMIGEEFLFIEG